jgi:hypothetical protein
MPGVIFGRQGNTEEYGLGHQDRRHAQKRNGQDLGSSGEGEVKGMTVSVSGRCLFPLLRRVRMEGHVRSSPKSPDDAG